MGSAYAGNRVVLYVLSYHQTTHLTQKRVGSVRCNTHVYPICTHGTIQRDLPSPLPTHHHLPTHTLTPKWSQTHMDWLLCFLCLLHPSVETAVQREGRGVHGTQGSTVRGFGTYLQQGDSDGVGGGGGHTRRASTRQSLPETGAEPKGLNHSVGVTSVGYISESS